MSFFSKKSFASVKNTGSNSSLDRNLSAMDLILLGLGAIIGTGVFAFTGLVAAKYSGPAVTLSYGIAGLVCIFVAFAYTELATMLPTSGSIYTYSYVAFGQGIAWLVGGVITIELGVAAAAVAGSWSAYVQGILNHAGIVLPLAISAPIAQGGIVNLPAMLIVFFVGGMLYLGTKESKKLNTALVFIKMAAITLFLILAIPNFDIQKWDNFMPYGFDDVLFGSSILFFAFTGFGTLASAAEECKNPKRDLTIGIIGSLILSTCVYMLIAAVLTGITHFSELDNAQSLAYALSQNGSNIGSILVAAGAIAGMTTVLMLNIYGQSRIFYVMARDGLLPEAMTKIHAKYDSPSIAIIILTVLIALAGGLLPYNILGQLSSMAALTDYILVAMIVMLFRKVHATAERPFKCPAVFVIAPVALISCIYLLFKQILDKNGELLLTGKIFITWFVIIFVVYFIRQICSAMIRQK
jgi:APA family basic amino acid/polyamine antiporter